MDRIEDTTQHRKNQIMIMLNMKQIPFEEMRETIRVKEKGALIGFYPTGNVEVVDNHTRLKRRIGDIVEYIERNW